MHFDLLTLYSLAIGTLLVGAGMTLWERQARPQRRRELLILAAGFATLAIGCAAVTIRGALPGAWGSALSNLVIVTGYLLILNGVAALSGRRYGRTSVGLLVIVALMWLAGGTHGQDIVWYYVSAVPIAIISGMTAWEALRSDPVRHLRSRPVVVAVTGCHALFYAGRAFVLPLLAGLGPGVVSVASKMTMYEGVLYSVALPMVLLAMIREEAHDQLLEASHTDYLTGLGNRRWFFEEGARMIRAGAGHNPLSLLVFDLDHFKTINDRYGHATGDEVLKAFARIARSVAGSGAILARIGGEEFAALLPGYDSLRAKEVGQAVARHFAETIAHGEVGMKATVSIGLAELGTGGTDLTGLLSAADRALYAAKALGRNRIELAAVA
jgi:diguanylate cyclase (GGDEF)-like protein